MVKSKLCIAVFLLAFLSIKTSAQNSDTLKVGLRQCVDLAMQNHAQIRDAELRVESARARKTQAAHARILPQFEVRNIWGPVPKAGGFVNEFGAIVSSDTSTGLSDLRYFTEFEMNLIQPIYTFGKLRGLNDAAMFNIQVEDANLEKKKWDVQTQVRELYWGLVLARELLAVIDKARNEVIRADEKIQEKLDAGSEDVSQVDLFKLQIFKYEVSKQHREALDQIEIAQAALSVMIGLEKNVNYDIEEEYLDPVEVELDSMERYLGFAAEHRPEVSQLHAGLNIGRSLLRVTRSDYYPQFFFAGQVKYNFAKDRFDPKNPFAYNPSNFFRPGFVVGANFNLNFWQTRDKVRLAEIEYRKLAEKEMVLDQGIQLEVQKAYLAARQAGANMADSRRALRASNNWLNSATMTFDLGLSEIKDLIDAFKANSKMQAEHIMNIFEYNKAVSSLGKAVGRDLIND